MKGVARIIRSPPTFWVIPDNPGWDHERGENANIFRFLDGRDYFHNFKQKNSPKPNLSCESDTRSKEAEVFSKDQFLLSTGPF